MVKAVGTIYRIEKYFLFYFIFQLSFLCSISQNQIYGKITNNEEILISATVRNISQHRINASDLGGNYKIGAEVGDTLVFSHLGYNSDTIVVNSKMIGGILPIELKIKIEYLKSVEVDEMAKYRLDSLNRRTDYDYIFSNKNNKKLWNNKLSGDGRGVNFSPIGYFSSHEKQKRKLKKKLIMDDKEELIYYKYSRHVPKLTGLTGDTLIRFINKYKPSYEYCLQTASLDMLVYINDKLILFKKGNYK